VVGREGGREEGGRVVEWSRVVGREDERVCTETTARQHFKHTCVDQQQKIASYSC